MSLQTNNPSISFQQIAQIYGKAAITEGITEGANFQLLEKSEAAQVKINDELKHLATSLAPVLNTLGWVDKGLIGVGTLGFIASGIAASPELSPAAMVSTAISETVSVAVQAIIQAATAALSVTQAVLQSAQAEFQSRMTKYQGDNGNLTQNQKNAGQELTLLAQNLAAQSSQITQAIQNMSQITAGFNARQLG